MNNIILSRKPIIKDKNGQEIIDITKKSIEFKKDEPHIINGQYVSEEHQMRVDLISYVNYGEDGFWDIICKFNAISNPFSVDSSQFLFIPDTQYMLRQLYVETSNNNKIVQETKKQYVDSSKKPKIDTKQYEYDKAFKEQIAQMKSTRMSKTNLPPNFSETTREATILPGNGLNNLSLGESG
jgi:hypothetical protein